MPEPRRDPARPRPRTSPARRTSPALRIVSSSTSPAVGAYDADESTDIDRTLDERARDRNASRSGARRESDSSRLPAPPPRRGSAPPRATGSVPPPAARTKAISVPPPGRGNVAPVAKSSVPAPAKSGPAPRTKASASSPPPEPVSIPKAAAVPRATPSPSVPPPKSAKASSVPPPPPRSAKASSVPPPPPPRTKSAPAPDVAAAEMLDIEPDVIVSPAPVARAHSEPSIVVDPSLPATSVAPSFDAFDRAAAQLEANLGWSEGGARSEPTDRLAEYAAEEDEHAEVQRLLRASEAPHVRLWRATRDEIMSLTRVAQRDQRSRKIGLLAFGAATVIVGVVAGIAVSAVAARARSAEQTAVAAIERTQALQAAERATWARVDGARAIASAVATAEPVAEQAPAAAIPALDNPELGLGATAEPAAAPVRAPQPSRWARAHNARRARARHPRAAVHHAPAAARRPPVAARVRSISWGGR